MKMDTMMMVLQMCVRNAITVAKLVLHQMLKISAQRAAKEVLTIESK